MSLEEKLEELMSVFPEREPFKIEWFAREYHVTFRGNELEKLKGMLTVSFGYAVETGFRYVLTDKGRACKEHGGHTKYQAFLIEEVNAERLHKIAERKGRWYEAENAEQMFNDYPRLKIRKRNSDIIAVLMLLIALASLIVALQQYLKYK